jgi:putative redox protein
MTQMKASYLGQLRTEGTHLQSGRQIITDAPLDNNGKGEAYSPTDMVAAALCSCMMTIMGIVAEREGIRLEGMTGDIVKQMNNTPRKISTIQIALHLADTAIATLSEKQKEILKKAALNCPVALSLHPELEQKIEFNF